MEKEEEILGEYIHGTRTGEDNKLRAVASSLNAKRSKELSDGINKLRETAQEQVARVINSNERLAKSNDINTQKTHTFTKVNMWLTGLLVLTSLIGLWNIYLTNEIKDESIRANQINQQPFLNFIDIDKEPYGFVNSGKGVALNFYMILWERSGKQLYITSEGGIGEAVGVGTIGKISAEDFIKTDFEQVKKLIPITTKLFEEAGKKDTSWFAILYEDIYGKKFVTLVRGPGGNYNEAVQFLDLNNN